MRAAWYERNGSAREVLKVGEMPDPTPGPGEVLVQIHASGVNPSDVKSRAGARAPIAFPRVIPHSDGAGIIAAVGALLTGSLASALTVAIAVGCLVVLGPGHFENA